MNLELQNINLKYSHKTVLNNMNLHLNQGQIHAILGENGAGKTTTANIICGELQPDSGKILLDDKEIVFKNSKAAIANGICYVHQHPVLAPSITILENLKLGLTKDQINKIPEVTSKWLKNINLKELVANTSSDTRFFIALCCALLHSPGILLLDEPCALLNEDQEHLLFDELRSFADEGMNIIVITHNYSDAKNYCDTISFFKDGKVTENYSLEQKTVQKEEYIKQNNDSQSKITISDLSIDHTNHLKLENINFSVYKGKITLITGLAEDGMDTLEKVLTGTVHYSRTKGSITLFNGKTIDLSKSSFDTYYLRNKTGISVGIIPTDKRNTASAPELTINQLVQSNKNIYLTKTQTAEIIEKSGIIITDKEKTKNLSGGMLQKLLVEKEFSNNPDFLILCNPLQGLDVQSEEILCNRIQKAAEQGAHILILSYGAFPQQLADFSYKLTNGRLNVTDPSPVTNETVLSPVTEEN